MSFADLGVSSPVVQALSKRGVTAPFAIQELVVADVLDGRDVLVQSPTGSGKTLAFGVPIVDRIQPGDGRPAALILAPTRELALQIVEEIEPLAQARSLSIAPVYGGVGLERQAKRAAKAHIVVATPGRLEDLLARRAFNLHRVAILVLDEADRMLDMGFKPAVDRIVGQTPRDRQTLFFSATLDAAAGKLARAYTQDALRRVHEPHPSDTGKMDHRFVHVEHADKVSTLIGELKSNSSRTLVFVRTKRGADRLVKRLAAQNVPAAALHGNKTQGQRERALAAFSRGQVQTLVATDVAARGIDVDDITHVINFDPPGDRDTFVHRTGRTGRATRDGCSVSFVSADQHGEMAAIARSLDLGSEFGLPAGSTEGGRRRNDNRRRRR
jgi:ATP-dependent RNA helicase RhlE